MTIYHPQPINTTDVELSAELRALPESEKEYDRNTAMQTIKTIIKLGYKITK